MDFPALTDDQLINLIENHRRKGAFDSPVYSEAMREWHSRHAGGLKLPTTLSYLHGAASERQFVSYGQLAETNGISWDKVRYPMNDHLWVLVDYAHRRGWPMLSAIIVSKPKVETGEMDGDTLAGFIRAAKALRYVITDERRFLADQQEACFAWGQSPLLIDL